MVNWIARLNPSDYFKRVSPETFMDVHAELAKGSIHEFLWELLLFKALVEYHLDLEHDDGTRLRALNVAKAFTGHNQASYEHLKKFRPTWKCPTCAEEDIHLAIHEFEMLLKTTKELHTQHYSSPVAV